MTNEVLDNDLLKCIVGLEPFSFDKKIFSLTGKCEDLNIVSHLIDSAKVIY